MILAGYETTANTLAYSIYLLGKNPTAQQQLLQEVDAFPQQPGYDDLLSFPYAAAVINEALRLYPPATVLTRAASQDVQVQQAHESCMLACCAVTSVMTCKLALHADVEAAQEEFAW